MIESGMVASYPNIKSFEKDQIVFENGKREKFDVVIYATGYRPSIPHLSDLLDLDADTIRPDLHGMESATVNDLFFVGLDSQCTFKSRYLRGIAEDGINLTKLIQKRYSFHDGNKNN